MTKQTRDFIVNKVAILQKQYLINIRLKTDNL